MAAGAIALWLMAGLSVHAQAPAPTQGKSNAPDKGKAAPAAKAPVPEAPRYVMPTGEAIVMLLRSSLLTLNDAMRTGNFTVMRDVAAPAFRDANTAFSLGQIFNGLSAQGVDLTAVAIITPQLAGTPTLDETRGVLRFAGTFPGNPVQINFDVTYQAVAGQWRLLALSVVPVPSVARAAPQASETAPAAKP